MLDRFPESRHVPCGNCGASVARSEIDAHVCERERWLDYELFQRRHELERFAGELGAYLGSPHGRFEVWCAERDRLDAAPPDKTQDDG